MSQRAQQRASVIITTINPPTQAVKKIADERPEWHFVVAGDRKTPPDWSYPGVDFLSPDRQLSLGFSLTEHLPFNHYARKNIGYLYAISQGAWVIAETDDDNIPYDSFLARIDREVEGRLVEKHGWENVYQHFTDARIWPRGLPLDQITPSFQGRSTLGELKHFDCPIQQFLADGDPDVDAIFRLTDERETYFRSNTIILGSGTFCPFNSQNTIWWPEAYALLYLPSFVSFRMTDIWRSFVAQVCLYRMNRHLAFREATVRQVRNEHSLIRDFKDELPGYLHNTAIMEALSKLPLSGDPQAVGENLRLCYLKLIEMKIVPEQELPLIDAWLTDLRSLTD